MRDGQGTLWEEFLPPEVRVLSDELTAIDRLLDDDRFLEPFSKRLACNEGRPTIPMETYLRLMYLKHRYSLGYETLVKEVADSLSWRRFCRIRLDEQVPHSTTLMKLTKRCGSETVDELNATLLRTAVERRVLRSRRLRVDTTAMDADVRYPTDSGLCAHAISKIGRLVGKVKAVGLAPRTRFRDRRRRASKVVRRVSHALGRSGSRAAVEKCTAELRNLSRSTLREATHVLGNCQRALRVSPRKGAALVRLLADTLAVVERVIVQTTRRLAGEKVIPNRLISLSDTDARPIRRGKPQKLTEFGYKVSIADTPEGFVVAHQVYTGNPADAQTLEAAVAAAQATGMRITSVAADRGYGDAVGDAALVQRGITDKVIPRKGRADPVERTRNWRRRYRWRAGAEGRISCLKREYGLRRTRLKGHTGATIWTGFGVLAHNVDRLVALS
ncbi:MAG TPA: ISNCY family transposase [Candidatus Acidoferrales bacterium]|nr:ISNCY family transposase [Candidatus Acidoferrales bacterium]